MSKRETKLILPMNDNNGRDLLRLHEKLAHELTMRFGGATASIGDAGFWADPLGQLKSEPVVVYLIAADTDEKTKIQFSEIALRYGRDAGQHSVYLCHGDGNVQMVEIPQLTDETEDLPRIPADKAQTYIF